jgi:hypothetical protein
VAAGQERRERAAAHADRRARDVVHAAVTPDVHPTPDPLVDGALGEAGSEELLAADDAALPSRERGKVPCVRAHAMRATFPVYVTGNVPRAGRRRERVALPGHP